MKMIGDYFGDLSITRGNSFQFLGMEIDINRKKKTMSISMKDQIKEALDMMDEDLKDNISSPAYRDLFTTYDGECKNLEGKRKEKFHSIVAKLLFITKRGRPDIETAILYLTTRVSKSNKRDWFKMKRVLSFLKDTIDDVRIIGASSLRDLYMWIDASYAVHENMRGHTGGVMSFGTGVVHARAEKQKLNVKSSTECELVETS